MRYRSVDHLEPAHVGHRVTVRRRLPEGGFGDVIGILEHVDPESVRVRKPNGELIEIAQGELAAARVIRPPQR